MEVATAQHIVLQALRLQNLVKVVIVGSRFAAEGPTILPSRVLPKLRSIKKRRPTDSAPTPQHDGTSDETLENSGLYPRATRTIDNAAGGAQASRAAAEGGGAPAVLVLAKHCAACGPRWNRARKAKKDEVKKCKGEEKKGRRGEEERKRSKGVQGKGKYKGKSKRGKEDVVINKAAETQTYRRRCGGARIRHGTSTIEKRREKKASGETKEGMANVREERK
ncbi:hypothetical protein C8J57DRAFT_1238549 [Mycena rebaudengoi]|nr:hypothetical protein C8J57DRAFT_1238549 [Mycena rebaudengoi]